MATYKRVASSKNAVTDGVIGGYAWTSKTLTFGFTKQDIDKNGVDDFAEGDWKDFYREMFADIAACINVTFRETATANASLKQTLLDTGGGGFSGGPGPTEDTVTTAVGIDPKSVKAAADIIRLGTFSDVWLHEIAHSLGLKHTHDSLAGPTLPGVADEDDKGTGLLNSSIYSVMGYTYAFWGEDNPFTAARDFGATLNAQPGSLGAIDIAALQHMYGARAHNTGNDLYRFNDDVDFNRGYTTLWDTGGNDTIAYTGTSRAKIDLRAATLKAEIGGGGWLSTSETLTGGFTIANSVVIENAKGGAAADILIGNAAGNVLDGGRGADQLQGLTGNDTYIVDNSGDRVSEAASAGTDLVKSSVSFTLGANVENLLLAGTLGINGTGNGLANRLTGNAAANILSGGAGNDTLDGGQGADNLVGGSGSDAYIVDKKGDKVVEAVNAGTDLVKSSISLTLAANVENLVLTGNASISGKGNALANAITGNAAANTLDGGAGSDLLSGNAGRDQFVFSTALGASNVDHIRDLSAMDDTIVLSSKIFTTLMPGTLSPGLFKEVAAAKVDASDRILYDSRTGALFYDADGSAAGKAVQFAHLDNKAAITSADFFIV
ncbi:alkaline phosphatase [Sinorhizobium americanum CCGM7]|uniref:M10 family metallopeptidase C-terminal domain-containing protein n=1 Tax=Sinorhizobium americanum TaxID=194963 RepID=UPI0004D8677E|nr:M10 family metallopeptidase C-terminal domain-containing protein [Sinorhizobium americanum]APG85660.1 alkaline phosphatase [Sinorhizobium americanum CCGM7]